MGRKGKGGVNMKKKNMTRMSKTKLDTFAVANTKTLDFVPAFHGFGRRRG
jgi:hypothetical protein